MTNDHRPIEEYIELSEVITQAGQRWILIVEDDELMRQTLRELLMGEGYNVEDAANGLEALEKARNKNYDLIVSDVKMPKLNGVDMLQQIKQMQPQVKAIIITGWAEKGIPRKAIQLGVDDYITKPFELDDLLHSIDMQFEMLELRKQNHELRAKQQENERLALIGSMARNIVHDIKNPISSVKGFLSLLQSDDFSEEQKQEFAELITNVLDRLLGLTTDIMDYSRGKIQLNFYSFEIGMLIDEVLDFMKLDLTKSGIRIVQDVDPVIVIWDKDKMKRVLFNLIKNAIDASASDSRIWLNAKEDGDFIRLEIKDEGMGIAEEDLDQLFQPFYSKNKLNGSGLGLPIAKTIVEEHNGTITARSEIGKGTIFQIYLPRKPEKFFL